MRHVLIVLGICVAAIAIGAGLYYYGPEELKETPRLEGAGAGALGADAIEDVSFSVIAEGTDANVVERKNYAAFTDEDFERLWIMAYGEDAPELPEVDFSTDYVIGVFAGEKPSGGYGITVENVEDGNALRNVAITLTRPGAGCMTTQALTSPFQIVQVPFSDRELSRTDKDVETACQ